MVNEMRTARLEADHHRTVAHDDPKLVSLVVALLTQCDDYPGETETWADLNRSATKCTGVVSQWRGKEAQAVIRLGGGWLHLQLLAYTYAYPELVDRVTRALEAAHAEARLPSAAPLPLTGHR